MTRFIKQYGMQRTGTNWTRAIIEANFQDVRVLVNVLGWKHGLPEPWPEWIENHLRMHNNGEQIIRAEGLNLEDVSPSILIDAAVGKKIDHVISIRNPYAYVFGLANHWHRISGHDWFKRFQKSHRPLLFGMLRRYNRRYPAWIDHARECGRVMVVRHEDVFHDARAVVRNMEKRFDLKSQRSADRWKFFSGSVEAKGDVASVVSKTAFQRTNYLKDAYMEKVKSYGLDKFVDEMIDWQFFETLGYRRGLGYADWCKFNAVGKAIP